MMQTPGLVTSFESAVLPCYAHNDTGNQKKGLRV